MRQKRSAMLRTMRTGCLTTTLAFVASSPLMAQIAPAPARRGFVNVSAGAQPRRQSVENATVIPNVYGETATVATSQPLGNGPIVDIGGGYRVWEDLYIGVGFSSFSRQNDSAVTASIPNPLFFDQFKAVTVTAKDLEHLEKNVYVQGLWFIDITDKIDVAVFGGLAFIGVTQAFVSPFSRNSIPNATQDLTVLTDTQTVRSTGGTVGFDGTYLIRRNIGVGLFARYVGGTVNIPGFGDLKAGGFHAGLGARYRF